MASSGNTWFKKLQAKQRKNTLRVLGVKQRFAVEPDQDTAVKKVREYLGPMVPGFTPRRRGSGCRLNHATRLAILERAEWRSKMRRELFGV